MEPESETFLRELERLLNTISQATSTETTEPLSTDGLVDTLATVHVLSHRATANLNGYKRGRGNPLSAEVPAEVLAEGIIRQPIKVTIEIP